MRLKARRARKFYKSDTQYIRAVYQRNREKIVNNISFEWLGVFYQDKNIIDDTLRTKKGIEKAKEAYKLYKENPKKMTLEERLTYEDNKKQLEKNAYKAFKDLVQDQMEYTDPNTKKNYTVERAILRESRSKDLNKEWTTADVYARNFHELIKKNTDIKEIFYQHEGISRIDYKQYQFLGYYKVRGGKSVAVYNYGDSYFLEYQSPKGGTGGGIEYISGFQWQRYIEDGTLALETYRKRSK